MTLRADSLPTYALAMLRRLPQPLQFLGVGGSAAATHLLVVTALVQGLQWPPLLANVLAFLVAFCVSYSGHALFTFSRHRAPHSQALPRFFTVACASFAVNEVLYFVALEVLHWDYFWSLIAVLVLVAVMTFVAAKFWAFARVDA